MTGPVLLSAIGFKAELVREPAMRVGASKIYGIATKHPKVAATRKALEEWSETAGIPMEVVTVRNAFDFVEWYYTWMTAQLAFAGKEIVINLTAGHAVASSTAAMIAAQKSLPCVCYDDIEDEVHHLNPSILLKLHELIPRDKEALAVLAKGPTAVGEVAAALDDRMSTISRSLSRLREWGFAHSTPDSQDSRRQIYELRPGVKEFLATILE